MKELLIKDKNYTCHQTVTDQINILGRALLQTLLHKMKEGDGPHWFSIIVDEATDVINSEQLNLSLRLVNINTLMISVMILLVYGEVLIHVLKH